MHQTDGILVGDAVLLDRAVVLERRVLGDQGHPLLAHAGLGTPDQDLHLADGEGVLDVQRERALRPVRIADRDLHVLALLGAAVLTGLISKPTNQNKAGQISSHKHKVQT